MRFLEGVGNLLCTLLKERDTPQHLFIFHALIGLHNLRLSCTGLSVVALAAGSNHNCALRNDTTLVCWGLNSNGQLGIGNTNNVGTAAGQMGNSLQAVNLGTSARSQSMHS